MFVTGGNYTTPSFSSPVWNNEDDINQVRKIKKSTIKNNIHHHYGSSGECFSFGLHNSYKSSTSNGITITHYAGDEVEEMKTYHNKLQKTLLCAFNTFDSIIPGISKDFYIMTRTLKEMSKKNPLLKNLYKPKLILVFFLITNNLTRCFF